MDVPSPRQISVRYAMIGACAALMQNAIMISADHAGYHFMIGNLLSFAVVSSFAFLAHSRFTFRRQYSWIRYLRYMTGLLSGLFIASLLFFLFIKIFELPMLLVAPLVTAIMLIYHYLAARWAIYLHGQGRHVRMGHSD